MIYRIGPAGLETKMLETLGIKKPQDGVPFGDFLKNAIQNQVSTTNDLIQAADRKAVDFALGKIEDIADVMATQEIANTALQFTVQLRNSLLDAYNEIMRLQV